MVRAWLSRVSPRIVHLWCWISMNLKYHLEDSFNQTSRNQLCDSAGFQKTAILNENLFHPPFFCGCLFFRSHQCPDFFPILKQPNSQTALGSFKRNTGQHHQLIHHHSTLGHTPSGLGSNIVAGDW